MSRAFTKELDGWNFCRARQRECSDAAFNGRCERDCCKYKTDDPSDPITREQLAAVLYRYAQSKGQGFTGAWMFPLDYPAAAEVSSWASEAMHRMVMNGVVNGKNGKLVPKGDASRAEAATMIQRFCENTAKQANISELSN